MTGYEAIRYACGGSKIRNSSWTWAPCSFITLRISPPPQGNEFMIHTDAGAFPRPYTWDNSALLDTNWEVISEKSISSCTPVTQEKRDIRVWHTSLAGTPMTYATAIECAKERARSNPNVKYILVREIQSVCYEVPDVEPKLVIKEL